MVMKGKAPDKYDEIKINEIMQEKICFVNLVRIRGIMMARKIKRKISDYRATLHIHYLTEKITNIIQQHC